MKEGNGKVHIVNSTTYEEEVDGFKIRTIIEAKEPKQTIPKGHIWHAILDKVVPETWAAKEMWVDRKDTVLKYIS